MKSLQTPDVKKHLFGLSRLAAAKSLNLTSLFHAHDTHGQTGRIEYADYEKVIRQIDPAIEAATAEKLFECFEKEEKGRIYFDYHSFLRELERHARARDTVCSLCAKLVLVLAERKQTVAEYLRSLDSGDLGFLGFDELERLAKDLGSPIEAAQTVLVFDVFNGFGADVKITFSEFEKAFREFGPAVAEAAVRTPRDDKVDAIAEEKLAQLAPTLMRLRQLLAGQHCNSFKAFLDKHCKSEDSLLLPEDFLRALRLLSPALNLSEARALLEVCQVDRHIRTDRLDEVLKRARRHGRSDQGRRHSARQKDSRRNTETQRSLRPAARGRQARRQVQTHHPQLVQTARPRLRRHSPDR